MGILTVSELTVYIRNLLDKDPALRSVFVRGEVFNLRQHMSGHCYFSLKDSSANSATIRAVMFSSRLKTLKFAIRDGMKVVVQGRVTVYERDGQYQLYADRIFPEGIGELSVAFAQLKEKLAAEGLFDEAKKRPLPVLPATVGVVTSPSGAAVRDILTVAKRRWPSVRILLFPVPVQGIEAPSRITRAIKFINRFKMADVIIVGRGGGSYEELWSFNEEQVVRAVAASAIPVVSAVGHETDFTLCDFAADRRAATPSQAAEIVVPEAQELYRYINVLRSILDRAMRALLAGRRNEVRRLADRANPAILRRSLERQRQMTMELNASLAGAMQNILRAKRLRLELAEKQLAMLNPFRVLDRGYAIVRRFDGTPVVDAAAVAVGETLEILLGRGILDVEVLTVRGGDCNRRERE